MESDTLEAIDAAEPAAGEEAQQPDAPPGIPPVGFTPAGPVVGLWLPEPSRQRIAGVFGEVGEAVGDARGAALVVVSTRGARARSIPLVRDLRSSGGPAVVALCHAGGEKVALEIMRAGGHGIVAEGNEAALARFAGADAPAADSLVDAYEEWAGSQRTDEVSASGADPVTGLPGAASLEQRLEELTQAGALSTVGFAQLANFTEATTGLDRQALDVLRRRIASMYRTIAEGAGAELFVVTADRFAFIGREMSPDAATALGRGLAEVARTFAPGGTVPIRAGVGFAGPDVAADMSLKRELAERALEEAVHRHDGGVVSADQLSSTLASATELDVVMRMVQYVNDNDGYPGSHSTRVADLSTEVARQLGYEGRDLTRIRLAALLHDVGKIGLPPEAMRVEDGADEAVAAMYRGHAERGARFVAAVAGPAIADAIRSHHERWDGSGFPDGLAGEAIPAAARIVALADLFDEIRSEASADGRRPDTAECLARLRGLAGSALDPIVVEAADLSIGR